MKLTAEDQAALNLAVQFLEEENFLVRVTSYVGAPIEKGLSKLPKPVQKVIGEVTENALSAALWTAARTTTDSSPQESWTKTHKLITTAMGGIGGWFGLPGTAVEIPMTTVIIMRSILDIARSEGADISTPEIQVECMNVFAFGGTSDSDDSAESSYFAARSGLVAVGKRAASYLASGPGKKKMAEYVAKFTAYLAKIAGRYAPVIAEKVAAQSVPIIGAVGGAIMNLAFTDHFQDKARGHFVVLRLEKQYGAEAVREEYESLRRKFEENIRPRPGSKRPKPRG